MLSTYSITREETRVGGGGGGGGGGGCVGRGYLRFKLYMYVLI